VIGLLHEARRSLLDVAQTIVRNRVNYAGLLRVRCDLFRKLRR
jgi:hypothetical protein